MTQPLLTHIALGVFAGLTGAVQAAEDDWKPIDAQHLSMQSPLVDENAAAEALFWEVRVKEEFPLGGGSRNTFLDHYIRIKIFNERGRESQSTINIPSTKKMRIDRIAARTIQPDGTILELDKGSIFERTLAKAEGIKIKVVSFALPGLAPGSIAEYRWRETRKRQSGYFARFDFQRDIPVQKVTYFIRLPDGYSMRELALNGHPTPLKRQEDGFFSTSMVNVPAFREEQHMPPEHAVRAWMLLDYSGRLSYYLQGFWADFSQDAFRALKPEMKVNKNVKRLAARLTSAVADPDRKLYRIAEYCRTQIKSIFDDAAVLSRMDRKKGFKNNSPSDTIKHGSGTDGDIDFLFAGLAKAAGFDARYALMSDRSEFFFTPELASEYFLSKGAVAVKEGRKWKFYSPSSRHLPFGMLPWQQEAQHALILDPQRAIFVKTPLAEADRSSQNRTALLRLDEEGDLQGSCRIEYTGHQAAQQRESLDDKSPQGRLKAVKEMVGKSFDNLEVSQVRIEGFADPAKPLTYRWQVRVPGYAQRAGQRLFLRPAFFQTGSGPRFTASERLHRIYFNYRWSEEDDVTIDLPQGMVLEAAESPPLLPYQSAVHYSAQVAVRKDGRQLVYLRRFALNALLFPLESYPGLKQIFDGIQQRDSYTLILKRKDDDGR